MVFSGPLVRYKHCFPEVAKRNFYLDGFQRQATWVSCWRHILIFEAKNIKGMKTTAGAMPRITNNHLTISLTGITKGV